MSQTIFVFFTTVEPRVKSIYSLLVFTADHPKVVVFMLLIHCGVL